MLNVKKLQAIRDKILGVTVDPSRYGDLNSTVYLQQIRDAILGISPARVNGNLSESVYLQQIRNAKRGVADGQFGSLSNSIYLQQIINAYNNVADRQFGSLSEDFYLDVLTIVSSGATVNPLLAGVVCPAITPTLTGVEKLANPGFEGVYAGVGTLQVAPNWNNSGGVDTVDTWSAEAVIVHPGGSLESQHLNASASSRGIISDNVALVTATWYQFSIYLYGSGTANLSDSGSKFTMNFSVALSAAWVQQIATLLVVNSSGNDQIRVRSVGAAANFYADDASIQPITFSSMRSLLGAMAAKNGTYICHPTVASQTQTGILIEYADDNNWVAMIVHRGDGTARLVSCIAGTCATARTGAITYGAAKELKCIVNGTTHQLFYDGTQVGADVTISNGGMGLQVHGFNSYAGNTVGTVSANP